MTDGSTYRELVSIRHPARKLTMGIFIALMLALFVARAPTSYTGGIPLIGEYVPLKLNAVYIIIFGPLMALAVSTYLWAIIAGRRSFRRSDVSFFGVAFVLLIVALGALCLQYFIVLAPVGHCDRLPNYDFLWTNQYGDMRIVHCMSGTADINEETPFYLRWQIVQSWVMALIPIVVAGFLFVAWRHVRRNIS
ncbi:hypothetical protein [Rhizobium laguerreae]|uniref:hypothetical protein n=1 Tax=Rhizobium laguerreae TaxID=1076926 RepID=UPI001FE684C1|nr:hypothetical protein [Rhizobium laguerreae]